MNINLEDLNPHSIHGDDSIYDVLFVCGEEKILILDISDLKNQQVNVLSTIKSSSSNDWYDIAISKNSLFIFSEFTNVIEEYDISIIEEPFKKKNYPVYEPM